jgi:hypothetical protein
VNGRIADDGNPALPMPPGRTHVAACNGLQFVVSPQDNRPPNHEEWAVEGLPNMDLRIVGVERIPVEVPFRDVAARNLLRSTDKPFWLQIVGTGITAAYSLHFAAVLSHATLPAVDCHQVYEHSLLAEPLAVTDGTTPVPDGRGLGLEIDEDAIERLRLAEPFGKPPVRRQLIEVAWPGAPSSCTAAASRGWPTPKPAVCLRWRAGCEPE